MTDKFKVTQWLINNTDLLLVDRKDFNTTIDQILRIYETKNIRHSDKNCRNAFVVVNKNCIRVKYDTKTTLFCYNKR